SITTDSTVRCIVAYEKLAQNPDVKNYRIAAFALENGFVYDQRRGWKKYIEDMVHDHSVRAGFTAFDGNVIELETGETDFIDLQIPLEEKWKAENLYAIAIVWAEDENGKLELVNIISSENQ
ncbi:MAG: Omp28-related outer membrane protein, partial [Bacteroidetes bacterium]|nr:Omp28-related outer membrane protein [Bacteroidota bacterium]